MRGVQPDAAGHGLQRQVREGVGPEFGGKQVLTQVIDHGHTAPGRTFDVTQALAKLLGLDGSQTIRWRFAG